MTIRFSRRILSRRYTLTGPDTNINHEDTRLRHPPSLTPVAEAMAVERLRRGKRKNENMKHMLDRIYRIARIDQEKMNDRSETPRAKMRGETLINYIKALEKLHGLGTS